MNTKKMIKISRKLATEINQQFPSFQEDDLRERLLKMLVDLHVEDELLLELFEDREDDAIEWLEAAELV